MDWLVQNVNLIAQVIAALFAGSAFLYAIRTDILSLKNDINHIRENQKALAEAFSQLAGILTKVAVQDARLNMLEKKVDELAHNKGFIV